MFIAPDTAARAAVAGLASLPVVTTDAALVPVGIDIAQSAGFSPWDGRSPPPPSADLIRMKQAAGRPKDPIEVDVLGAVHKLRSTPDRTTLA